MNIYLTPGETRLTSEIKRRFPFVFLPMLLVTVSSVQGQRLDPGPKDQWAGKTVSSWNHIEEMIEARLHHAPKLGAAAPVTLITDVKSGESVFLSDLFATKPVVLFFGSYSCVCSQESAQFMSRLNEKFGEAFHFVLIYIREAHPTGGISAEAIGGTQGIDDPTTFAERAALALRFASDNQIHFRVTADSMDDLQAVQWSAWPARIYSIDRAGRVSYAGQQGPWFVKPTPTFDLNLRAVPENYRDMEGYSRESLEEFLENWLHQNPIKPDP